MNIYTQREQMDSPSIRGNTSRTGMISPYSMAKIIEMQKKPRSVGQSEVSTSTTTSANTDVFHLSPQTAVQQRTHDITRGSITSALSERIEANLEASTTSLSLGGFMLKSQMSLASSVTQPTVCEMPRLIPHPKQKSHKITRLYKFRTLKYIILSILFTALLSAVSWPFWIIIMAIVMPIAYLLRGMINLYGPGSVFGCCINAGTLTSGNETIWMDNKYKNHPVLIAVLFVNGHLDLNTMKDIICRRIINAIQTNGRLMFPKYTEIIESLMCGYAWTKDSEFDINNHVYAVQKNISSPEALKRYVSELAQTQIPSAFPPWQLLIVDNGPSTNRTALILRMHQALTDGMSLLRVLCHLTGEIRIHSIGTRNFAGESTLSNFRTLLAGPGIILRTILPLLMPFREFPERHLSGKKKVSWSCGYSLDKIRDFRAVAKCTINDVLVAVAAGCLRDYFIQQEKEIPENFKALIPVDLRSAQGEDVTHDMSNKISSVSIKLPVDVEGCVPRIWHTRLQTDRIKQSVEAQTRFFAQNLSYRLWPGDLHHWIWDRIFKDNDCIISSIRGPDEVTISAMDISAICYWMPCPSNLPLSIGFITYSDFVVMCVSADEAMYPNIERIVDHYLEQMHMYDDMLSNKRFLHGGRVGTNKTMLDDELFVPTIETLEDRITVMQAEINEQKQRRLFASSPKVSTKRHKRRQVLRARIQDMQGEIETLRSRIDQMKAEQKKLKQKKINRSPMRRSRTLTNIVAPMSLKRGDVTITTDDDDRSPRSSFMSSPAEDRPAKKRLESEKHTKRQRRASSPGCVTPSSSRCGESSDSGSDIFVRKNRLTPKLTDELNRKSRRLPSSLAGSGSPCSQSPTNDCSPNRSNVNTPVITYSPTEDVEAGHADRLLVKVSHLS